MIVYRVETKFSVIEAGQNFGPYSLHPEKEMMRSVGIVWSDYPFDHHPAKHPEPEEDGIEAFTPGKMFCGFSCLASLHSWFKDARQALILGGFYIAHYDVPNEDIFIGGKQLAYYPDRAVLVGCEFF